MVEIQLVRPPQPLPGAEKIRSEHKKQSQDQGQGQPDHPGESREQPLAENIDEYA